MISMKNYPTIANEVMPDLGYEIKDFQYYTWRITGWSGLEKRITSPEFETSGWKWNTDVVSIYLDFADPEGAPVGWCSYVQFALLLWNPEDPTSYVSNNAHHRFTAKEPDWGFTRFYPLHKLFAPSENRTRPLIENNACNITAFICIVKDPTDVIWHDFKNEEIKAEESHLYLSAKHFRFSTLNSPSDTNFDDRRYPLTAIPQLKVLKSETYRNFKRMAAKRFGYSSEQIRFWVFINRQNKTVRPKILLTDNFLDMTIEKIYTTKAAKQNELKFFLEAVDKPANCISRFPQAEGDFRHIIIFIKYFNSDMQSLEGLGYLYVKEIDKVSDIIPFLCEKKGFPQLTPLKIYEEIRPNMIEEMKPNLTFQQSEIQDGDIICFQKALTQKALTEEEVQGHTTAGRICDIPAFYESLSMRIVVHFKPRYKDREPNPEFELVLNKEYTYDDITIRVAARLSTNPLKFRFTRAYGTVVERATAQTLSEMLESIPSKWPNILIYETLDI
ncbi:15947_t:CDS:10 [Gigaspora margarita]|uniref:15947_t:CDS:1 n=1 Tax=Gigaspora margarita TaxID=4874 RepID=A0ABN7VR54_GIGMA|nr:15947_t:CDS:10 [Gigaspora margarita]